MWMHMPQLGNIGSLALLGAMGTTIAAGWSRIKSVSQTILGFAIRQVHLDRNAGLAVLAHLRERHHFTYLSGVHHITTQHERSREFKDWLLVALEPGDKRKAIVWVRRFGIPLPFLLLPAGSSPSAGGVGLGQPANPSNAGDSAYTLVFPRGLIDLDGIVGEAMRSLYEQARAIKGISRFRVETVQGISDVFKKQIPGPQGSEVTASPKANRVGWLNELKTSKLYGHHWSDLAPEQGERFMQNLSLAPQVQDLYERIGHWFNSRKWFEERQVPWKMGLCLHGKPGTGKTAFCRSVAQALDLPVFLLDLATMDNRDLRSCWSSRISCNTPCMAVVEDIDGVFEGRRNIAREEDGLTFDCLLNCIDGVEETKGVLFVITTNRVETLDPALAVATDGGRTSRPGRIDYLVEMPVLDQEGRRKLASRILRGYDDRIEEMVRRGEGDTGAQFQARCVELAQSIFWREENKVVAMPPEGAGRNNPA